MNIQTISIIIPIYNEAESLPELFERLASAIRHIPSVCEVICIDDGSRDASFQILVEHAAQNPLFRVLKLKRNFGQTAALAAGIVAARGTILVTLDSDLENDPADIPKLLEVIQTGECDIASGNRVGRWKGTPLRRLLSWSANAVISFLSGVPLHDYGCTLKAYKREIFDHLKLYGEMHRMIPAYAAWLGYTIREVDVTFAPRKHGSSNYSAGRLFSVVIDLVTLKFMQSYFTRPSHFFGKIGLGIMALGGFTALLAVYFKISHQKDFIQTPLPVITAFLIIMGFFAIFIGIFSEILTRIYFESQKKEPYLVEKTVGKDSI